MTLPAVCLLLTRDADLARRLGAVAELAALRVVESRADLDRWRERSGGTVVLFDLRHDETAAALADLPAETRAAAVAFGLPESGPFLAAGELGVLAVEPLEADLSLLRASLRRAVTVLHLQDEVRTLRQQLAEPVRAAVPSAAREPLADSTPVFQFARATRQVHDAQRLLDQVVEGIVAATCIARVGVFARLRGEPYYEKWVELCGRLELFGRDR